MTTTAPGTGLTTTGRRWMVLIPVASVMYLLAFIDRTNISFVLPSIGDDLDLSNADKGLVSGVFFLGYIALQVPAALLAYRWSAKWIVFIVMIMWGLAAMASGLVQNFGQFIVARLLLGLFEGAVQPTVLVLLTRWFAQRERARASGFWLLCLPLAGVIGAPLTGFLLDHYTWRTVLVIEGIPPILWAFVWLALVADRPSGARWVTAGERDSIAEALARDEKAPAKATAPARYRDALHDSRTLLLVLAWFFYNMGFYGFTLWLPQVITDLTGGSEELVGWLTAVPYLCGLVGMVIVSVRTDRHGSRPLSAAGPLVVVAAALFTGQFLPPAGQLVALCVVAACLYIHGAFFALPPLVLRAELLALSLGLIGGIGNLGGFVGPYLVGWLIDVTGSTAAGFAVMSAAMLGCGICLAVVTPRHRPPAAQIDLREPGSRSAAGAGADPAAARPR